MKKISSLLSKINMGCIAKSHIIEITFSKLWLRPLALLYKEGFIQNYYIKKNKIYIYLRYFQGKNCIRLIKNFVKPSQFIYVRNHNLWLFNRYNGLLVLSTIKGLKTHEECMKEKLGGKAIFFVG